MLAMESWSDPLSGADHSQPRRSQSFVIVHTHTHNNNAIGGRTLHFTEDIFWKFLGLVLSYVLCYARNNPIRT